ncbi:MAG: hypothetical protein ACRDRR_21325 [Pseudonocardiaceae bacterium]
MTWYRDKPPEEIRASALDVIAKKQREGCGPCVDAYVDLARRHGSTDEQVARALGRASDTEPRSQG